MTLVYSKFLLFVAFTFVVNLSFSQNNEIKIKFIGNCGLYLTDGITNIYTDFPYKSGAHNYMEFDSSEIDSVKPNSIFIFTHKHSDHYSKKNLRKVLKGNEGQTFGPWNISDLENLGNSLAEFNIKAFKTEHKVFGISFKHYSYLITWHGKRIYLSGDTTNPDTIGNIENIDLAFIPYWILKNANDNGIEIDAKMYAIYHLYPEQIPSAKENWDEVDNIHPLTKQGETLELKY